MITFLLNPVASGLQGTRSTRIAAAVALSLTLALAGCGGSSAKTEMAQAYCPSPQMVQDATRLTRFKPGPGRAPFSPEIADLVEPFAPPVVSFHFGLPPADLIARVKGWGSKVLGNATTVDEALWLEQHGADAIIAQGWEAGGHRGHFLSHDLTRQPGTFALLPQIVRAVRVPVIAAGGIADVRGIRAALALGIAHRGVVLRRGEVVRAGTAAELAGALGVSLRPLELVLGELVEGRLLALGRENGIGKRTAEQAAAEAMLTREGIRPDD